MSSQDEGLEEEQALGFSTVIASTVHDMKNSLGMLMQAHSALAAKLPAELHSSREQAIIEYESMRLNGMLVQMLGLYKLGVNRLSATSSIIRFATPKALFICAPG